MYRRRPAGILDFCRRDGGGTVPPKAVNLNMITSKFEQIGYLTVGQGKDILEMMVGQGKAHT